MGYRVVYHANAQRTLRKLDRPIARRIADYLDDVGALDDPRTRGKSLTGDRGGIWRYRVGDYRVLCEIRSAELVILALQIGHRGSVYDD